MKSWILRTHRSNTQLTKDRVFKSKAFKTQTKVPSAVHLIMFGALYILWSDGKDHIKVYQCIKYKRYTIDSFSSHPSPQPLTPSGNSTMPCPLLHLQHVIGVVGCRPCSRPCPPPFLYLQLLNINRTTSIATFMPPSS